VIALATGLLASACSQAPDATSPAPSEPAISAGGSDYQPEIDPANFVEVIDNPLFPLEPGTAFYLRGENADGVEHETITVTDRTKVILGVTTTVVRDVSRKHGEIVEATDDWYAQDRDGNVWDFGEDASLYQNGKVLNKHGSWEAGVDGAQPGIIMSADPQVTDSYREEYYEGHAEDMFWVVATGRTVHTPMGRFGDGVITLEYNPLDPKIVIQKSFAPGVGLLEERALSGPKDMVKLIGIKHL
jgi:hypothetical protein